MSRIGNVLDPIHAELDPLVWENPTSAKPVLKSVHAHWIKSQVYKTLEDAGYTDVERWLTLIFTGSLTTYQYSANSDVDISLFVDTKVFPEWSRAEMIALMVDQLDGRTLPGTPYPLQDFVVGEGIKPSDLYKPGLRSGYNLDNGKWIVPPERDRAHDVKAQEGGFYAWALQMADKMERLLQYEPDQAIAFWHSIHKKRRIDMMKGKGDFAESNIIYKMLANRGLFPQISQVSGEYIAKVGAIMYHLTPWYNRESIQQHGLMEGDAEGLAFLSPHPSQHYRDRDPGQLDTWAVDVSGLAPQQGSDFDGMPEYMLPTPIPPERMRLHTPATSPQHNPEYGPIQPHHERILQSYGQAQAQPGLSATFRTASKAPQPPNYKEGTTGKHCSNCKMYDLGRCWGYGNKKVKATHVCDSWAAEHTSRTAAPFDRQLAKFVYDPATNRLLMGQMGRAEGEQPTHNQLLEHPMWGDWSDRSRAEMAFGTLTPNGYGSILSRTRLTPGLDSMNPYQKQYQAERALQRAVSGVRFTNPTPMLKPEWELADDPAITYIGEPPVIEPAEEDRRWDFQAKIDTTQVAQRIYEKAIEGVGSTINLHGESPHTRYGFAPDLATQTPFPLETFTAADVEAFIQRFSDRLRDPEKFVGSWIQGDQVILDVTEGHDDFDTAYQRAWNGHQKSLWDSEINDEIPVRGLDYQQPIE